MSRLSGLQEKVLASLAGLEPAWTLTGGGALVGFHLGHRETRDLDLFWHGQSAINHSREQVLSRLRDAGFEVGELQSSPAFAALRVSSEGETVVLDLVAEPVPTVDPPLQVRHLGVQILVDSAHEILVNKLCALLHRSELRDLVDIQALMARGEDLERALADAPRKDGGFSAMNLGYSLKQWPVAEAARAAGLGDQADALDRFRNDLLGRVAGGRP